MAKKGLPSWALKQAKGDMKKAHRLARTRTSAGRPRKKSSGGRRRTGAPKAKKGGGGRTGKTRNFSLSKLAAGVIIADEMGVLGGMGGITGGGPGAVGTGGGFNLNATVNRVKARASDPATYSRMAGKLIPIYLMAWVAQNVLGKRKLAGAGNVAINV